MKFKVGDKVRVRKDLEIDETYGENIFVEEMKYLWGEFVTISKVCEAGQYRLVEDETGCCWTDKMLEPANEEADEIDQLAPVLANVVKHWDASGEKPEPVEEQKKVLVFPEWAKWIARDEDGSLWVYENEPNRNIIHETWEAEMGNAKRVPADAYTFSEIGWEGKPIPINLYAPAFTAIKTPDDSPDDAPAAGVDEPDDSNRSIYTPVTQTPDPKIALHKQITEELTAIYEAKNHDYGDSFQETYRKLGLISAVTRITDKVNRLQSLCTQEQRVVDESILDTLMDCANYCIMTIIALEGEE